MQTLGLNATGDDVKTWQAFLRDQGLYAGAIDGSFGPRTLESSKAFQRAHGLRDDGVVGARTWDDAKSLGLGAGNGSTPQAPPPAGGALSLTDPWEAPAPPGDGELFVVRDPRVITDHRIGVLPCPKNPPPPVGWAYWKGPVSAALAKLAVEVETDATRFPMSSFVQATRDGQRVAARVEWHDLKGKTGERGCFRGTNLFRPSEE
jgi:peptidoglycan hydrolase-like protein with peptidoglycan-binding domain